ncbi:MAG: endonuclease VIII [Clostridiales bacterium]|nr:endonuclease VIII [Clostridiales bacterium]
MIELPEALSLPRLINERLAGKAVVQVFAPTKPHRFCWFSGDASEYDAGLRGSTLTGAEGFGIYAELAFDNGRRLCVNDGVNMRLVCRGDVPKDYQLLITFDTGEALVFTVAMYGGIVLHAGDYDNEYYLKSRNFVSPFSPDFEALYYDTLKSSKPSASVKEFLATGQHFPGIGNGVLQDILFDAGINPRSKLSALGEEKLRSLLKSTVSVLRDMTDKGGRDTEKNILGAPGGYITKMSRNALKNGCPVCSGAVTKEAYLGGSVYYCSHCQPVLK